MELAEGIEEAGWEYQGCAGYRIRCVTQGLVLLDPVRSFWEPCKVHRSNAYQ